MSKKLFTALVQKIAPFLQIINPVTDWIWPAVRPKTKHQLQEQETEDTKREKKDLTAIDNLSEQSTNVTKKAHKDVMAMLEKEMERNHAADNKLATLFALSTISTALVLSVNGLAIEGVHNLILLVTFYCLVQLIRLLLATLNGLKRRSFSALNIADIAPFWIDTDVSHQVKIMSTATKNIHEYQRAGNDKREALDIAYAAFRNFLVGLTLLFVVSIFLSPEKETLEIKTQKIIYELQHHPFLLEILRSPPSLEEITAPSGLQEPPSSKGDDISADSGST